MLAFLVHRQFPAVRIVADDLQYGHSPIVDCSLEELGDKMRLLIDPELRILKYDPDKTDQIALNGERH